MAALLTLGNYNDGTDELSSWTDVEYAWDDNTANYAYKSIATNTEDTANFLTFTGRPDSCPDYTISKVEVGVFHYESRVNHHPMFSIIVGGDTLSSTEHNMSYFASGAWEWAEVTSDDSAPSPWTAADIDALDVKLWSHNGSILGSSTQRISAVAIRVTIEPSWADGISAGDTFTKEPTKVLTEIVNIGDALTKIVMKSFSEIVNTGDSASRLLTKAFTEAVKIGDSFLRTVLKGFSEIVNIGDSFNKTVTKVLTDVIKVADSLIKTSAVAFSEIVRIADSCSRTAALYLYDAIKVCEDSIWATLSKVRTDAWTAVVKVIDLLTWEYFTKTTKAVSDWTKRTIASHSWTSSSKKTDGWSKTDKQIDRWSK